MAAIECEEFLGHPIRPEDGPRLQPFCDGMFGEVRAVCDPDNLVAEFAIQVATDCQRRGLGRMR